MPIDTYLNQQVTRKPKSGVDKFGKPTTGTNETIEARLQESTKRLVDESGKEYQADAELWIKPTQTMVLEDVINDGTSNFKVVRIDTKRGFTGSIDHKKCYLKRTKE